MSSAIKSFERFFDIIKRLRAPDGCPWDLEQTPRSLRGSLIEETYECVEAIDEENAGHIREELGDVFLLAGMISYMHEQAGIFSLSDVLEEISDKLIRRHPHVFGEAKALDSGEVLKNWARIKVEQEGRSPKDSVLDEVSRALPPLDRAFELQKKAAKRGFDWTEASGVFAKVEEELDEVKEAAGKPDDRELEAELGDLLFSAINLCRFLKINPSAALQGANVKFTRRFKYVEKKMKEAGCPASSETERTLMEKFWNEAKSME
ncbi:MAG: nucleoside triphosphate pyrophosphohydrolase [Spirochaetaceae bacterium]|nr:nucleoside triphosphate pyrophosphohydrolase [Spirochaetaceae bacterium]